jgi:Leucine-rich repeat (LRR) protein
VAITEIRSLRGRFTGVDLSSTTVTDAGLLRLRGLSQLQTLNLGSTAITDAGLAHLKCLTKLQELDLSSTKVTDAGVAELKKALPKVTIKR